MVGVPPARRRGGNRLVALRVTVVGGGIVGLSAATQLVAAGHAVTLVAAEPPAATVSAVAGGLWSPFEAGPPEAVARWARAAYDHGAELAASAPAAGVRMVDALVVGPDPDAPLWWEACAPPGAGRPALPQERAPLGASPSARTGPGGRAAPRGRAGPGDPPSARVVRVPFWETATHLRWLTDRLAEAGVRTEHRRLATIDEAWDGGPDAVVACLGLAARELLGDRDLVPIRGVVVLVRPEGSTTASVDSRSAGVGGRTRPAVLDDGGPHPTYVLPRADGTVLLGGRVDRGDERPEPTPDEVADVLARCTALVPALAGAEVIRAQAGLRPGRPSVRVEAVDHPRGPLVVDHGHGGSGWTLAHGCAQDVVALLACEG